MRIIHKKEINSTNTYLKENYKTFADYTVLYADHQTAGKGRITHNWYDEKKQNLLMSIIIKDLQLDSYLDRITLVVAVAVYNVLTKYITDISIKWPNDIYVSSKKICGILTEGIMMNNHLEAIIIGIGLNVNGVVYPEEIKNSTSSLKLLTGRTFNRKRLLKKIVKGIRNEISLLQQNSNAYLEVIKNNFYLQNKMINFEKNGIINNGMVLGIDDSGQLIVKTDSETLHLYSGEVTLKK